MLHDVKNIFHFIIIFQCVLFSYFLISEKNGKRLSNALLATLLIIIAVTQIGGVLSHFVSLRDIVLEKAPHLLDLHYPFYFAYVPVLYLYALSVTQRTFYFKKFYVLHFMPLVFFFFLIILKFLNNDPDALRMMFENNLRFSNFEDRLYSLLSYIQFFAYMAASLILIKKYQDKIKNIYSTIEQINLTWLNFVVWGFIGWKSLRFLGYILWLIYEYNFLYLLILLYITAEIVFLGFVSLMFIKGLRQPAIFLGNLEINSN
jgi:hypothetical protein